MNVQSYLQRISYAGDVVPSFETLENICSAHIQSVPFENLSVIAKEPIEIKEELLFSKIVHRRRGGFCYEMNGVFQWLLKCLGYDVILLAARVFNRTKRLLGPEFDHLTLSVAVPEQLEERYLVDVGFPDAFKFPLRLLDGTLERQGDHDVRLRRDTSETWYVETRGLDPSSEWEERYRFTLHPRQLSDYTKMCLYHQTSPEAPFTQKRLAVISTKDDGRLVFTDEGEKGPRIIETKRSHSGTTKTVTLLEECQVKEILKTYFGLVL